MAVRNVAFVKCSHFWTLRLRKVSQIVDPWSPACLAQITSFVRLQRANEYGLHNGVEVRRRATMHPTQQRRGPTFISSVRARRLACGTVCNVGSHDKVALGLAHLVAQRRHHPQLSNRRQLDYA